jgi:two-component system, cell cycle sensor histidine kinase and response regulator CckA
MAHDQTYRLAGDDSFYRRLFECAPVAMIATDSCFRVVAANAPAGRLLGEEPPRMIGRFLWSLVPAPRRRLLERLLHRSADGGEMTEFNVNLPDTEGKTRWLAVLLSPLRDSHGGPAGVAAWIIDETQRKRLADRARQMEKMASLGTLAGGIAHHFNNILGGVATFVDFALTSDDPLAMRRALAMTADAVTRAAKITQGLLSFASKDHFRSDLSDLTEVILTFVHLVERPLAEKNIRVRLDLHPIPVLAVEGNRMQQVLGNLLTNAEEAMPAGGTIEIALDKDGNDARLMFADTGCGIDQRHIALVFEPFFTTKGLLAGGDRANPGLGLSIVHGIITEMGGRIAVESRQGEYTKFTIRLPISRKENA